MFREVLVMKVEKIEDSSIVRSRGRSRKSIGQTINREPEIYSLSFDPCRRPHLVGNVWIWCSSLVFTF